MVSSESVKGFFKPQTLKEPKLVWLGKVHLMSLKSWVFVRWTETDKCTFSEGWPWNVKEWAAKQNMQMEYSSD